MNHEEMTRATQINHLTDILNRGIIAIDRPARTDLANALDLTDRNTLQELATMAAHLRTLPVGPEKSAARKELHARKDAIVTAYADAHPWVGAGTDGTGLITG